MEQESRLYKVIYQSVLTQIYSGVLRYGQVFPSQFYMELQIGSSM